MRSRVARTLLDLVLPAMCGGCGRTGTPWCDECAAALALAPIRVRPRTDPGVACWALGGYRGPGRRAVLAVKERGRRDLVVPLGAAMARGLALLRTEGRLLVLVPAPSRRAAARRRGGDPVLRAASAAGRSLANCRVAPILSLSRGVRDSVGLNSAERARNLRGRVRLDPRVYSGHQAAANAEIVLIDDVLTTGATAAESVGALTRAGLAVSGVLVICAV
ncbi:ComF family protein [Nocardia callitridis]|uniref:ComF family protein n=1 Tax=Nocardia callitridis TaxID=648753 RepID=A0ABP9JT76_9NOCA